MLRENYRAMRLAVNLSQGDREMGLVQKRWLLSRSYKKLLYHKRAVHT